MFLPTSLSSQREKMFCTFDPHLLLAAWCVFHGSLSYNSLSLPRYIVKLGWIVWIKSGPTCRRWLLLSTWEAHLPLPAVTVRSLEQSGLFRTCLGGCCLWPDLLWSAFPSFSGTVPPPGRSPERAARPVSAVSEQCRQPAGLDESLRGQCEKLLSDSQLPQFLRSCSSSLQPQKVSQGTGLYAQPRVSQTSSVQRWKEGVGMPWTRSDSWTLYSDVYYCG